MGYQLPPPVLSIREIFRQSRTLPLVFLEGRIDLFGLQEKMAIVSSNLGSNANNSWVQAYVGFSCWHIWKSRCEFVFNQVLINSSKHLRWSSPTAPFYKANVDATARYSIAASSVAAAEAFMLLHGCDMVSSLGLSSIVFESDSLESISCLNVSMDDGCWEAFPILVKIKELGESFQDYRWSWVPRLANVAADSLASTNNPEMCDVIWADRPLSSLVHVLNNDNLPCPH
ncbi:hypothetical protein ACFX2A_015274 [Malus domestica]